MGRRLIQLIPMIVLLTITTSAQVRKDDLRSLQERALQLEPYIVESALRYGIDARILRIVCFMESRFQLDAVSPKGARGPMQFTLETARRYRLHNPHDARTSIDAAARYLRDLLKRFGGRVDLALAAYNAGEGTVDSFLTGRSLRLANGKLINPRGLVTGGVPPYRETSAYVRSGMALLFGYQMSLAKIAATQPDNLKVTRRPERRDFTIDVFESEIPSWLRGKEKPKSFFIDVQ